MPPSSSSTLFTSRRGRAISSTVARVAGEPDAMSRRVGDDPLATRRAGRYDIEDALREDVGGQLGEAAAPTAGSCDGGLSDDRIADGDVRARYRWPSSVREIPRRDGRRTPSGERRIIDVCVQRYSPAAFPRSPARRRRNSGRCRRRTRPRSRRCPSACPRSAARAARRLGVPSRRVGEGVQRLRPSSGRLRPGVECGAGCGITARSTSVNRPSGPARLPLGGGVDRRIAMVSPHAPHWPRLPR